MTTTSCWPSFTPEHHWQTVLDWWEKTQIQLTGCCWKWPFLSLSSLAVPWLPGLAAMIEDIWKDAKLKSVMGELRCVCSKIRVSIAKRNMRGPFCRPINGISSRAGPTVPPLCQCPGAVGFYTTTFMRDRNGWVQLKTNGRPIKCKGFPGEPPVRGPTTRFIYSSQRRGTECNFLNANKANFLF